MAVPALITAPTSCASGVVMSMTRVVGRTVSPFTLEDQAFRWSGDQWSMEFTLPPQTTRARASEWIAFGLKLEGSFNQFLMGDPSARVPMGIATGIPLVDGSGQEGNILATKGWTASTSNILRRGDYIQVGSGSLSRLHMVLDNVNSDGAGLAAIPIAPNLRYSPGNNNPIVVSDPKGVFRMVDNTFSWAVSPGGIYRLGFRAVEVINA